MRATEQRFFELERKVLEHQNKHKGLHEELDSLRATHAELKDQKAQVTPRALIAPVLSTVPTGGDKDQ